MKNHQLSTRIVLGAIVLLLVLSKATFASTVKQLTIKEMIDACQLVFEGQVVNVESRLEGNVGRIETYVTFELLDVVKGYFPQRKLELSFLGGTVGDRTMAVDDLHTPELGERGIYFVRSTNEKMVNPLCGWDQGHFLILTDRAGNQRVTTRGGKRVTELGPGAAKQSDGFSNGIALGVSTSDESAEKSLTVYEFKDRVRRMIRAVQ